MEWYAEVERWYIGGFLTLFGLLMAWKGEGFSSCSRVLFFELRDARLRDRFARVVERRKGLEAGNDWAWRLAGFSATLIGVLVLVRVLNPLIGYALLCADFAIVMSQIYLHMRNRSERRAASLQPRTPTSTIPLLWYAGGLATSALAFSLVVYPSLRVSAVIVALACLAIVAVSARTAQMAALLAGDDPEVELYVDNRLRWSRIGGLLMLAYASSYVFIALSGREVRDATGWQGNAEFASWILFVGFGIWAVARFFFERMRANATRA